MSRSPDVRWPNPGSPPTQRRLPPTPEQRRMGVRIALGLMVLALLVIALLDHFGVLH